MVSGAAMEEPVKIDRTKWRKPTYRGHYDERATCYEGISTRCRRCESSFVFLPEEQKVAFELSKRYPGWLPSLCPECRDRWADLERRESQYRREWESKKENRMKDFQFVKEWLILLEEAQIYRQKGFEPQIQMLKRLLSGKDA
jgi:hypothetical protein